MKPNLLILLAIALLCVFLIPSCAGWEFQVRGPYGEASAVGDKIVITPLPIVLPSEK